LHSLHVNDDDDDDDDDDYEKNTQGCKAFIAIQASTALPGFYKRIPSPLQSFFLFTYQNTTTTLLLLQSISIQTAFKAFKAHKHHCYQSISQHKKSKLSRQLTRRLLV
jgi:hypothetical protein